MSRIAAIIPCYNVEKYCRRVIEETLPRVDLLVLVDDGSKDRTHPILQEICSGYPDKTQLVAFPVNRGKGVALLEGMRRAMRFPCDVLITLDSDGQHTPSEIPLFVERVNQGVEMVIGEREFSEMPPRSRVANSIISFLLKILYRKAPHDNQSGFRAFSRGFVQKILDQVKGTHYEMEFSCLLLALRDEHWVLGVPIETIYLDKNRSSHFSVVFDSFRILKVFFAFCWGNTISKK